MELPSTVKCDPLEIRGGVLKRWIRRLVDGNFQKTMELIGSFWQIVEEKICHLEKAMELGTLFQGFWKNESNP